MPNNLKKLQADLEAAQAMLAFTHREAKEAQARVDTANREVSKARAALDQERKREERRVIDRAREGAKRLAAKLGVTIEKEDFPDGPIYWVYAPDGRYPNEEDDPLCGTHSCVGWQEVLQAVETYAKAFEEEAQQTS